MNKMFIRPLSAIESTRLRKDESQEYKRLSRITSCDSGTLYRSFVGARLAAGQLGIFYDHEGYHDLTGNFRPDALPLQYSFEWITRQIEKVAATLGLPVTVQHFHLDPSHLQVYFSWELRSRIISAAKISDDAIVEWNNARSVWQRLVGPSQPDQNDPMTKAMLAKMQNALAKHG